jgi:ribosomal protein S18 acetylase RimI-like enzyme
MQAVTAEAWRLEGRHAPQHVGDLAWGWYQHSGREHEWRVRLWQHDGRDVAWAWLKVPDATVVCCVLPHFRESLTDDVLGWAQARVFELQSSDGTTRAILVRRGYVLGDEERVLGVHHRGLCDEPEVEAPDGRLVSYYLAWLDPDNRVGEFEPVGTHPEFRRLGLGSAVSRFALRRLAEEDATRAVVDAVADDPANPGAKALYESIGFVETSRLHRYAADLP